MRTRLAALAAALGDRDYLTGGFGAADILMALIAPAVLTAVMAPLTLWLYLRR